MTPTELIVDSFAGGGGASLGISWALGRHPDIAINHDAEAIALHSANHPTSTHYNEDVWAVDPITATEGRPVGLMWLSPDCTHHSKARGGKPVSKRRRGLAWVAVRWAKAVRPRVIVLENVEEFQTWGPLGPDDKPDSLRKGLTFRRFVGRLRGLGYVVEWRELRACDYGTPTIRKRLFLIARCDGEPIAWPAPTHGKHRAQPWRTAAECIDWSIPCPSIFTRTKPLAINTQRRIAAGLRRYVLNAARPFIVQVQNASSGDAPISVEAPMRTVTAHPKGGGFALVAPSLINYYTTQDDGRERVGAVTEPLPTQTTENRFGLVAAFLAKHYSEKPGQVQGASLFDAMPTVTATDHNALVASSLVKLKGTAKDGQPVTEPLHTVAAGGTHFAEVRAFLLQYYGNEKDGASLFDPAPTVTTKDRLGVVTVEGNDYVIADIGMRMLAPRELYRAQGFPDDYRIDIPFNGKPLSKTAQVRMCGNSVVPQIACAIVTANLGESRTSARVA